MNLHQEPFILMDSGTKKSELRLNDEKRRNLKVGDTIIFTNREVESKTLVAEITYLHNFPTFREMFHTVKKDYLGWEEESFVHAMYEYYLPEDESRWGTLEIGVCVISN